VRSYELQQWLSRADTSQIHSGDAMARFVLEQAQDIFPVPAFAEAGELIEELITEASRYFTRPTPAGRTASRLC
jgi:hypothetical protein